MVRKPMFDAIPYHLGAYFARFTKDWFCRWIAWNLAEANWWLRPRTRRLIVDNLRIIHPEWTEKERLKCARRTVHNFARSILLFLQLPYYSAKRLYERCDMTDLRTEVDKLGKGKPFIIATGHVGPWELGAFALVRMGYTVHTVALDHPNPQVTKFYNERREYVGVHAHPLHGSFPLLKEAIDRGECVALMIDRAYGKVKKRFTMFGVQRDFPLGHLVLSARGHAPVLTGIIVFDGPNRFRYVHGGTHYPEDHEDEFEKLERLQEDCLRDLERLIRDHSDHWFHFRPIERTEV
jgi:lauroyl/myristoyl acyltransferase